MTASPQPSLTPQQIPVSRTSLEKMKIMLDALRVTILNLNLDVDSAMQMLVEEIMALAGSVGAAIALKSNDQIVCRASAGQAPGVGTVLQSGQGLSGECVLSRRLVRCDDTDVDGRVNPQVCRDLGFRSALIAPIMLDEQAIGLVELLAAQPHQFNQDDVLFLNEVAGVVLELNSPTPLSTNIERGPAPESDFLEKLEMKDLISALEHDIAAESAAVPEIDDTVLMEGLELIGNGNAVPAPKSQRTVVTTMRIAPRPHAARRESADKRKGLIWLLAVLIMSIIVGGIWRWRTHRFAPATQPPQPQSSSATPGTLPRDLDTAALTTVSSAAGLSDGPAGTRFVERPVAAATGTTQKRSATLSPRQGSTVFSGTARSALDLTPAPSIASLGAVPSNAPLLPLMGEPAGPVFQPTKVSSGLHGGTPVYQPRPIYPEMAKRNGVTGDVVLKFFVTKAGAVTNVRVVSGNPELAQAAMQSVRMWRYRPFLLNGEPTEAESQATIKFTSPR